MTEYWVTVYRVGRRYGGPEEGGWWYDTGTVELSRPAADLTEAEELAAVYRDDYPYTGRRGSVLGGDDWDVVVSETPGVDYPTDRPRWS